MRFYSKALILLLLIILTACNANNSITEQKMEEDIDIVEDVSGRFVGDFIELDESDVYELSLYTTGGVYSVSNLDNSEIYRMLKDIIVVGANREATDEVPAGGTSGGNILVIAKDSNVRYNFKITGQTIRYDGQLYNIESANELVMFVLETRILLQDFMEERTGDNSLEEDKSFDYNDLLEYRDKGKNEVTE